MRDLFKGVFAKVDFQARNLWWYHAASGRSPAEQALPYEIVDFAYRATFTVASSLSSFVGCERPSAIRLLSPTGMRPA